MATVLRIEMTESTRLESQRCVQLAANEKSHLLMFDLLSTVEYGGCSAKLSPSQLAAALSGLPKQTHPNLLVDIQTHDDAGVYKINDQLALVQTTDFFSPICSDPFEFGQIAAANALSDVYAMGGTPITALNLAMFPSKRIPLEVLSEILRGGQEKVLEAGAVIAGGHTIDDYPPKYGLAVTGIVHPDRVISNSNARPGDVLILTKPLGMGVLVAAQKVGLATEAHYRSAIDNMKLLNRIGSEIMQEFNIQCATDVTGFGLLGHALKMATASRVTLQVSSAQVPLLAGVYDLLELGCIPGACFRNQSFVEADTHFSNAAAALDYNLKMALLDAQTSGGLLFCAPETESAAIVMKLRHSGLGQSRIIGRVMEKAATSLVIE